MYRRRNLGTLSTVRFSSYGSRFSETIVKPADPGARRYLYLSLVGAALSRAATTSAPDDCEGPDAADSNSDALMQKTPGDLVLRSTSL
jgi:hypothetical protein